MIAELSLSRAKIAEAQGRPDDADRWIDRAVQIGDRLGLYPIECYQFHRFRAELAWVRGRREAALVDLGESLRLAEAVRGKSFGADREHAAVLVRFNEGFETDGELAT